ncbi:TPA: hypothetical protein NPP60_004934 [Klebsiella variicola subsp. variicola]|nr:hypothetical protein [Klebsiella variicola subsp. variicola]
MPTIINQNHDKSVSITDAGEGMVTASRAEIRRGIGGRYTVFYGSMSVPGFDNLKMPQNEYFDDLVSAMRFYRFQCNAEIFAAAIDAGLNDETAEAVAAGEITLETALGDEPDSFDEMDDSVNGEDLETYLRKQSGYNDNY